MSFGVALRVVGSSDILGKPLGSDDALPGCSVIENEGRLLGRLEVSDAFKLLGTDVMLGKWLEKPPF
jgi:hypothetical protein